MHDPNGVDRRQRVEHLIEHGDDRALGQRSVVTRERAERPAGDQLQRDHGRSVVDGPRIRGDDVLADEPS